MSFYVILYFQPIVPMILRNTLTNLLDISHH